MYRIAREIMEATLEYALTYHDKHAINDVITEKTMVYVFMPRKKTFEDDSKIVKTISCS